MTTAEEPEIDRVALNLRLRNGAEMVLRSVLLGDEDRPVILIEPAEIERIAEGVITFAVDATGFGDAEGLADVLDLLVAALRGGDPQ